jgi:hypothetical protein
MYSVRYSVLRRYFYRMQKCGGPWPVCVVHCSNVALDDMR